MPSSPRRRGKAPPAPPSDPTTAWAEAAVRGEFVVGELVRHAAERHLRDLRDGASRGIYWNPDAAQRALDFLPALFTITDGPAAGQPFKPLPWHTFVVGSLFGWLNENGRWRFRSAWLETGKGQAKSPLMAGLGLYAMGWCGIPRAQVYAIAQDKNTANVLFKDAVAMCRSQIPGYDEGESLEAREDVIIRGEGDNAWKIEHPESGAFFRSLAGGETQSGPRPAMVLADEIHEFKSDGQIETWRRAIAKVAGNSMMILGTNTPATTQHVGTSYSEVFQAIAKGKVKDDTAFGFVARVDRSDWETVFTNEAAWPKALPALGITFPIGNIREEVNTARTRLSTATSTKRLYFGIPTGAADFWIDEQVWAKVQVPVDEKGLVGRRCWLSLDLARKNDLTALSATWELPEDRLASKTWYWTTQEGLPDRATADQAPYEEWVEEGHLVATPGSVIDYTFVAMQVKRLSAEHKVEFLAVDPAFIAEFIEACDEVGFPVWKYQGKDKPKGKGLMIVSHNQGPKIAFEERQLCMPHSIVKLEDHILNGTIEIDDSPVTYSCAANAAIMSDGQDNRAFDKKRSRGRIDGIVTIAMGVGAAAMNAKPKRGAPRMLVV
ncbi:terminase TerL endonuclease subunit [Rhizorhabdus sp.]|uniref:terminase large subunit n=1 Tax=Rhizorhabdus sp. TaxID=1968843 RepID=UPI0019BE4D7E|nr:terminase TerL endonuclease subunit [Rhizorhabdus sp.]MBD3762456.1 terminase [Rhizorhabdus sp.]